MELPNKKNNVGENSQNSEVAQNTAESTLKKEPENVTPKLINTQEKNNYGILPTPNISKEERERKKLERQKIAKISCTLKNIFSFILFLSLLAFAFFWLSLSTNNYILSNFNIYENLGQSHQKLVEKNSTLELEIAEVKSETEILEEKIRNKNYTIFSEEIRNIKQDQIVWFDFVNEEKELELGILNGAQKIADYFNDEDYKDEKNIISGRHGKVEIKDLSATREKVSFSVKTTQILEKIIYLNIELINALNSLPIYKNGQEINNFSREKNDEGDYQNEFSLSFDVQKSSDNDLSDKHFENYIKWSTKKFPNLKIKKYNINITN